MSLFLTPREVAERWHCTARHVRRLCASGDLPGMRIGLDAWRIAKSAVEAYEAGHTTSAEPAQPTPVPSPSVPAPSIAIGGLPDDYEPVFPELWGMEPRTTPAAPSAAGRGRSATNKKAALSR